MWCAYRILPFVRPEAFEEYVLRLHERLNWPGEHLIACVFRTWAGAVLAFAAAAGFVEGGACVAVAVAAGASATAAAAAAAAAAAGAAGCTTAAGRAPPAAAAAATTATVARHVARAVATGSDCVTADDVGTAGAGRKWFCCNCGGGFDSTGMSLRLLAVLFGFAITLAIVFHCIIILLISSRRLLGSCSFTRKKKKWYVGFPYKKTSAKPQLLIFNKQASKQTNTHTHTRTQR